MSIVDRPNPTQNVPASDLTIWHWPLFQSGWKGVLFMLALIGVFLLVRWRTEQSILAAVSLLAVLAVTTWFWLPIKYVIRPSGIERTVVGIRKRIPWSRVGGFETLKDGIRLYPAMANPGASGGLFISWNGNQPALESMIEYYTSRGQRKKGSSISIG